MPKSSLCLETKAVTFDGFPVLDKGVVQLRFTNYDIISLYKLNLCTMYFDRQSCYEFFMKDYIINQDT